MKTAVKRANRKDKGCVPVLAFQPSSFQRCLAISIAFPFLPSFLDLPRNMIPAHRPVLKSSHPGSKPLTDAHSLPWLYAGVCHFRQTLWQDRSHRRQPQGWQRVCFQETGLWASHKQNQSTRPCAPEYHFSPTDGFGLYPHCICGSAEKCPLM